MVHAVAEDVVEVVDSLSGLIYEDNADRLHAGTGGRHSFDDLMQEVRLKAVQGFPAFRASSDTQLEQWILRIAHNVRKSMISRERAQRRDVGQQAEELPEIDCGSVLEELEAQISVVNHAMGELNPRAAYVVQQVYYEQRDQSEVAKELKISVGALRNILSRALAKIRNQVQVGSPDGPQIDFDVPDEAVRIVRRTRRGKFVTVEPPAPKEPSPGQ